MKVKIAFWLVVFVALTTAAPLRAQDCTQYNIQDKYSTLFTSNTYTLAKNAICQASVTTTSQARSAEHNAGVTIPIDDIVLGFTYGDKSAESDFGQWKNSFCASSYNEAEQQLYFWQVSNYMGANQLQAVKACFASQAATGTYTVDPDQHQFTFEFRPNPGKEGLYRAAIEPASAVSNCNANNPFNLGIGAGIVPKDISGQKEVVACTWTGEPLHITLNLKSQGQAAYSLPSMKKDITPPTPPAPPPPLILGRHTNNDMKSPFSFDDLPQNMSCKVIQNNDRWVIGHDGRTAPCPGLIVYDGKPGQNGRADSGPFEGKPIDYTDNSGVCSYVFSCETLSH